MSSTHLNVYLPILYPAKKQRHRIRRQWKIRREKARHSEASRGNRSEDALTWNQSPMRWWERIFRGWDIIISFYFSLLYQGEICNLEGHTAIAWWEKLSCGLGYEWKKERRDKSREENAKKDRVSGAAGDRKRSFLLSLAGYLARNLKMQTGPEI